MEKNADPRIDIARTNLRMAVALRKTNFAEAARQADLSRNALSQFIAGKTSLSYANMLKICDVLNIPISLLHRPDTITEARVRLYRLLERLPDHLINQALQDVQDPSQN
jgi:transcriptional regulator with XRE-family HTH domain